MVSLAQTVRSLSFETWCRQHDDNHRARWCRELYPWDVFAAGDYEDSAVGRRQSIGGYWLTVTDKEPGKVEGRTQFRVSLETQGQSNADTWRNGRWADDFVLVAADDGHFITLFTKRDDPAKNALMDFMTGRFDRLDAKRCLAWSALLFRTLVAEIAASLGTWERGVEYEAQPTPVRSNYSPNTQFQPDARVRQSAHRHPPRSKEPPISSRTAPFERMDRSVHIGADPLRTPILREAPCRTSTATGRS